MLGLLYLIGRGTPIPWVIPTEHKDLFSMELSGMIEDMLGKDPSGGSVLALGLGPYMSIMVFMRIFMSIGPKEKKPKFSRSVMRKITLIPAFVVAAFQALLETRHMEMRDISFFLSGQVLTVITLVAGCAFTIFLAEANTEKGFGGMSLIIMINILTNTRKNLVPIALELKEGGSQNIIVAFVLVVIGIGLMLISAVFDYAELRLKTFRVMINNELSEVGYLPIRLNPSGAMPIMFAMTFFLIPYYAIVGLGLLFPENHVLKVMQANMNLNCIPGILLYLGMILILNFAFASVFVDPVNIAKQFRETGDCLVGYKPGKETEKAIKKELYFCCCIGAAMQGICIGAPLISGALQNSTSKLYSIPMTMMILTGISLSMVREARVLIDFRDYKPFL
ncbi:MAG: hypothetical protein IJ589_01730 [Lachnospiraceae bacterium]|nr:hypothetical protein [Lachnospiraceae bacterium]